MISLGYYQEFDYFHPVNVHYDDINDLDQIQIFFFFVTFLPRDSLVYMRITKKFKNHLKNQMKKNN